MKSFTWIVLFAAVVGLSSVRAGDNHRLGAGANYWVTVNDIDVDDIDKNGFSYLVSYQYRPTLIGFEVDGEMLPNRFGKDAYAPQAYIILGQALYAAAGIGITYQDSKFADEPFYALKAGFDINILPGLYLDIAANYRFNDKDDLEDEDTKIDTDTVFLGATARLAF